MCCDCKCRVALPHGAVDGLQYVIVVFLDHTHLLCGQTHLLKLDGIST